MALFFIQKVNLTTRLAIWEITEEESFFRQFINSDIKIAHPHKRLQHLAGRFLLKKIDPDFPINDILMDGKRPYLADNSINFSISHSGNFAAAIISKNYHLGVDIEPATPRIEKLAPKYLDSSEQSLLEQKTSSLTLQEKLTASWCAKECMFKWYKKGQVDFRHNMHIRSFIQGSSINTLYTTFSKDIIEDFEIKFRYFGTLCVAWLISKNG